MITAEMRAKYLRYLASEAWQRKRAAVLRRCKGRCERCGQKPLWIETHHLTYKRLYRERLSDLLGLCHNCHQLEDRLRREAVQMVRDRRFREWKQRTLRIVGTGSA